MKEPRLPLGRMILWFPFAIALTGVGLGLCFLPWLFIVGVPLLLLAAFPYAYWLSKKIHADIAYANRDHTTNDGEKMPWFETEETAGMTDDEMIDIILNRQGRGK